MNGVLSAIAERSSIRAYTDESLSETELEEIITAGLQAPTARNEQEIHFTILKNGNPILDEIEEERALLYPAKPDNNFFYNAPIVIFVSGRADFQWSSVDAGIAVENMAIAATSLGLGSLVIGCIRPVFEGEKGEYFRKACQFKDGYEFKIAFAVGHGDTEKAQHPISYEEHVTVL